MTTKEAAALAMYISTHFDKEVINQLCVNGVAWTHAEGVWHTEKVTINDGLKQVWGLYMTYAAPSYDIVHN